MQQRVPWPQFRVILHVDLDIISVLINYQLASTDIIFLFLPLHPAASQGCAAEVLLVYGDLKTSSDNKRIFHTTLPESTELEIMVFMPAK